MVFICKITNGESFNCPFLSYRADFALPPIKINCFFYEVCHRNILGIAFNQQGQLWTHEMGPKHGDEFNLIIAGDNYGWPLSHGVTSTLAFLSLIMILVLNSMLLKFTGYQPLHRRA